MEHESGEIYRPLQEVYDELRYHLIPNMRKLFMLLNPFEYDKWQGNCCRQSAMMTAMALGEKLGPGSWMDVKVVEKHITGFVRQFDLINNDLVVRATRKYEKFEHSFVNFSIDHFRTMRSVDMSFQLFPPMWYNRPYPGSIYKYPSKENPVLVEGHTLFDTGKDKLIDWRFASRCVREFYSGLKMTEIYEVCKKASKPSEEELHELRQRNIRQIVRPPLGQDTV